GEAGVGALHQPGRLPLQGVENAGMRMSQAGDAPTGGEIQVGPTRLIPDLRTPAVRECQGQALAEGQAQAVFRRYRVHRCSPFFEGQKKTSSAEASGGFHLTVAAFSYGPTNRLSSCLSAAHAARPRRGWRRP